MASGATLAFRERRRFVDVWTTPDSIRDAAVDDDGVRAPRHAYTRFARG